jgi:hypothetical protein
LATVAALAFILILTLEAKVGITIGATVKTRKRNKSEIEVAEYETTI